jgi:hypothetical protein
MLNREELQPESILLRAEGVGQPAAMAMRKMGGANRESIWPRQRYGVVLREFFFSRPIRIARCISGGI